MYEVIRQHVRSYSVMRVYSIIYNELKKKKHMCMLPSLLKDQDIFFTRTRPSLRIEAKQKQPCGPPSCSNDRAYPLVQERTCEEVL